MRNEIYTVREYINRDWVGCAIWLETEVVVGRGNAGSSQMVAVVYDLGSDSPNVDWNFKFGYKSLSMMQAVTFIMENYGR
jgi:hypothetical protein